MKQTITINEEQLRSIIGECINEAMEEGRLGNFLSSVGSGAKEWWRNGGVDAFKQGYGNKMAHRSYADYNDALARAEEFRAKQNAGYANIPGMDKIEQKYGAKINKIQGQIQQLNAQLNDLEAQKKQEKISLKKRYMSDMGKQASRFGAKANSYRNTGYQAQNDAEMAQNRRRASLGLDPVGQQQQYAATGTMNESKLDRIIRESIHKNLMGL